MSDWIPVKEKLPEKEGYYLISLGNEWDDNGFGKVNPKKKVYRSSVRISHYEDGKFYYGMVAAWMPVPYPYRGE